MTDVTAKLAEALLDYCADHAAAADSDPQVRVWVGVFSELLDAYEQAQAATPAPAQDLPLPKPHAKVNGKLGTYCSFESTEARRGDAVYTADQMRAYARAAQAATPAPAPDADLLRRLQIHGAFVQSIVEGDTHLVCTPEQAALAILDLTGIDVEWAATPAPAQGRRVGVVRLGERDHPYAVLESAFDEHGEHLKDGAPLYTAPQATTPAPAPLTDEQIEEMVAVASIAELNMFRRFARAIERAHGIGQGKEASNG